MIDPALPPTTASSRTDALGGRDSHVPQAPAAGGGLGAFSWEMPTLLKESGRSLPMRDNPGNAYLQSLAETGVLGFVVTLLFCLALAREAWLPRAARDRSRRAIRRRPMSRMGSRR